MARYTGFTEAVKETIRERSGGRCEAMIPSECTGIASEIHHRRTRGMGGTRRADTNLPANGLHLCRECHRWVTEHPAEARESGWVVRQSQTPSEVRVLRRGEWVRLFDDGAMWGEAA